MISGFILLFLLVFGISNIANAQIVASETFANFAFAPLSFVSKNNISQYKIAQNEKDRAIEVYCTRLKNKFSDYKWSEDPCGGVHWDAKLVSNNGHPLVYKVFGKGDNTTLFLGGVHPDELTPVHLAFKLARYLRENPSIYTDKNIRVVIAPLVNPDGFIRNLPSRTNANGVDVNRNFLTYDWYHKAISTWRKKRLGEARYFPGYFPNTEIETFFQVGLIDQYSPGKVISIHAPLGFLDYDGPGDQKPRVFSKSEKLAKGLVNQMSEVSKNYRIVDYSFYPGSLGNYAGNERGLATITLELETTDPKKAPQYWKQFLPSLLLSLQHPFTAPERKLTERRSKMLHYYHEAFN